MWISITGPVEGSRCRRRSRAEAFSQSKIVFRILSVMQGSRQAMALKDIAPLAGLTTSAAKLPRRQRNPADRPF
jgi:hypothetical protein